MRKGARPKQRTTPWLCFGITTVLLLLSVLLASLAAHPSSKPLAKVLSGSNCTAEATNSAQSGARHHLYDIKYQDTRCKRGPHAWVGNSTDAGAELFGTSIAQDIIYRHQHPADCSASKYFVHLLPSSGIGSQLHVMGAALAVAMDMGRIFLEAPGGGTVWTRGDFCVPGSTLSDCYFVPFSNCTLKDAGWSASSSPAWAWGTNQSSKGTVEHQGSFGAFPDAFQQVPEVFQEMLAVSRIPAKTRYYWWRSQAAAFMVRPNERTLQKLQALKEQYFADEAVLPGSISVHVRHGDKGIEAELVSDEGFWETAQRLAAEHPSLRRNIFLTTEDPGTVAFFQDATQAAGWTLQNTSTPLKPDKGSVLSYAATWGASNEYLWSLLNLDLALEADGFVGTLYSNWCRLIDELRSTVRCKAQAPYLDADQKVLPYDVNWRRR